MENVYKTQKKKSRDWGYINEKRPAIPRLTGNRHFIEQGLIFTAFALNYKYFVHSIQKQLKGTGHNLCLLHSKNFIKLM